MRYRLMHVLGFRQAGALRTLGKGKKTSKGGRQQYIVINRREMPVISERKEKGSTMMVLRHMPHSMQPDCLQLTQGNVAVACPHSIRPSRLTAPMFSSPNACELTM